MSKDAPMTNDVDTLTYGLEIKIFNHIVHDLNSKRTKKE
jgi:hypothetical protein